MYYQIIKRSHVRGLLDCVGKVMHVHNITTAKIKGEVLGNSNIGKQKLGILILTTTTTITDQHLVLMLNMVRNGVSQVIVKLVISALTVILELNNNFILKFTRAPNVMMYNKLVIARVAFFVHLLT